MAQIGSEVGHFSFGLSRRRRKQKERERTGRRERRAYLAGQAPGC